MASIIYSWNHVPSKRLEVGQEYSFVETLRKPNKINPYRATIEHIDMSGDMVSLDLSITKSDPNKRYPVGLQMQRHWSKEDGHSGTTLIYNNYETGTSDNFNGPELFLTSSK